MDILGIVLGVIYLSILVIILLIGIDVIVKLNKER